MAVTIVRRQGLDDFEPVARWEPGEGFVDGDARFTTDDVYAEYDREQVFAEFDGPDLFAVDADRDVATLTDYTAPDGGGGADG